MLHQSHRMSGICRKTSRHPHTYVVPSYCPIIAVICRNCTLIFPRIAQLLVWHGSHSHYLFVQHYMVGLHYEDGVVREVESECVYIKKVMQSRYRPGVAQRVPGS